MRNDGSLISYDVQRPDAQVLLERLSSLPRRHDRNAPLPCSFYAKGACSRGSACPYRHVLSSDKPPTLKSYRDRYYGSEEVAVEFSGDVEQHAGHKKRDGTEEGLAATSHSLSVSEKASEGSDSERFGSHI